MRYSLGFSKEQADLKAELDTSYVMIQLPPKTDFQKLDMNWPQDMVKRKLVEREHVKPTAKIHMA